MPSDYKANWSELLRDAVSKPGSIHEAYSTFHNYSLGNQLLAMFQCKARNIQIGPLGTYPKWQSLGRHVIAGQKAITLCRPVTVTKKDAQPDEDQTFTFFKYENRWFVLSQTDGAPLDQTAFALPEWD